MQFGVPATQKGDTDFDGDLDFDDIAGFVDILPGTHVAAHAARTIPEPAGVWLMATGIVVLGSVRLRRRGRRRD